MEAMGSDAAIEAADVVLMDDDPMKIVRRSVSQRNVCVSYMRVFYLCIGIKVICLILASPVLQTCG